MQSTRSFTDKLFLVIKGLGMGAANKVPGVSGGVVAFVAGFYEEFIYSLQKVNGKAFKLLINGRFSSFFRYINGRFLSLLFFGMIVSYFSVSKILDYLIVHYELFVWSVFFGMIIGSIYYINKDFKDWKSKTIIALIIGISTGLGISFLDPATQNDNLWFVFFCGIISVSGMTLPGFSGSFILILLGNYVLLLVDSVNALYDTIADVFTWNFDFISNLERIRMLKVLAVFTLGSVTGLVTFSHILNYVLKHYKNITLSVLMGFIIGSLGVVWPWKKTIYKLSASGDILRDRTGEKIIENYQRFLPELNSETLIAIGFVLLGILIVLALEWYGHKTRKVHV
jgi:putative membrane protein